MSLPTAAAVACQAEAYPVGDAFIPLLPPDYLVSYSDVLPGLRRFDSAGALSVTPKQAISTLAAPMMCPTHRYANAAEMF
jgi:nephrocystin-4